MKPWEDDIAIQVFAFSGTESSGVEQVGKEYHLFKLAIPTPNLFSVTIVQGYL